MKKFLALTLAAALVLVAAVTATGQSQYPVPQISSFSANLTPKKAGTKKRPKASKIRVALTVPKEARATADRITFLLPRHMRTSGKGFKFCPYTKINAQGASSCSSQSRVGSGTASAAFGPNLTPITFDVTVYVGSTRSIAVYLQARGLPIQKAIEGIISRAGSPYYQKLTIIIPPELQRQLGAYVYLTGLDTTLGRTIGKGRRANSLITTIGCPKDKKHRYEARIHFVPNPNPPTTADVSKTTTSSCSGRP